MQKAAKTTTKREKRTHMAADELKRIRLAMKFAPRDMCATLGLPRRTYQDYEAGKRGIPAKLATLIREMFNRDREFMATINDRVDAAAKKKFPNGIPSEVD